MKNLVLFFPPLKMSSNKGENINFETFCSFGAHSEHTQTKKKFKKKKNQKSASLIPHNK